MRPSRPAVKAFSTVALCVALVAVGCAREPDAEPGDVLAEAKETLDAAETVRFDVTGDRLPNTGIVMVSGKGIAKRPSSFAGSFRIATGGIAATVGVVSIDGDLYAQVPFTDRYTQTTADELGVVDPARLIEPEHGISSLLTEARRAEHAGSARRGEEVVIRIEAGLPAASVARFLFLAETEGTIPTVFAIERDSGELRSAEFTGPFYEAGKNVTYTVTLDDYDEPVEIERPDTGDDSG